MFNIESYAERHKDYITQLDDFVDCDFNDALNGVSMAPSSHTAWADLIEASVDKAIHDGVDMAALWKKVKSNHQRFKNEVKKREKALENG